MKFSDEAAIYIYNNFSPEDINHYIQSAMSDLGLYEAVVGTIPDDELAWGVHPSDAAIAYAMCIRYKNAPKTGALVWSDTGMVAPGWIPVASLVTSTPPDPKKLVYVNGEYIDITKAPSDTGFATCIEESLDEIDQVITPSPMPKVLLKEYKVKDRPGRAPVWAKELMTAMRYVGSRDIGSSLKEIAPNPRTALQIYHLANVLAAEVLRAAPSDAKVSSVLRQVDEFLGQVNAAPSKEAITQLSEMFK